jgi:hypothetical protein
MKPFHSLLASAGIAVTAGAAHAQFTIDWYTIDSGSGAPAGGPFSISGTVGQPDAAIVAGGPFQVTGGFWVGGAAAQTCYPNCDNSTVPPILNIADFVCFQQAFAAGSSYANCDNSTVPPVLNIADFVCFQQSFAAGCP